MRLTNLKKTTADVDRNYQIHLEIGFILALLILIALFRIPLNPETKYMLRQASQETVTMEEVVPTKQVELPPAPPMPQIPVSVPNDAIISDAPIDISSELDFNMPLNLPLPPPPSSEEMKKDSGKTKTEYSDVFVVVERMPVLIGGIDKLQGSIKYPEMAKKAGIEGRVYVKFIISEKGRVIDPVVVRGIGGGCDEAALEAVTKARFEPGMQRGRAVKVWYTVPIVFQLKYQ